MMTSYLNPMKRGVLIASSLLMASQAFASGYEKSVFWSGRYSGVAGAVTSSVEGSQSLYFNPAGLATKSGKRDFSMNISPTTAEFSGPIGGNDNTQTSKQAMVTPIGFTYSQSYNDQITWGVGLFNTAGSDASYEEANWPGHSLKPTLRSRLAVTELTPGVSYKINDEWKVGAAYRIAYSTAALASASTQSVVLVNLHVNDITATNFDGFRLGAQYTPAENWGLGLSYRSELRINGKGKSSGTYQAGATGTVHEFAVEDARVSTILPMQVSLAGHYDMPSISTRFFAQYDWTQYSRVNALEIDAALPLPGALGGRKYAPNIEQRWQDESKLRLAGEYTGYSWPIRVGYAFTSAVTTPEYARAVFVPPGPDHTLTLGTGQALSDSWRIDGGIEGTMGSGDSTTSAQTDTFTGSYEVKAYAVHLGANYTF